MAESTPILCCTLCVAAGKIAAHDQFIFDDHRNGATIERGSRRRLDRLDDRWFMRTGKGDDERSAPAVVLARIGAVRGPFFSIDWGVTFEGDAVNSSCRWRS